MAPARAAATVQHDSTHDEDDEERVVKEEAVAIMMPVAPMNNLRCAELISFFW